MALAGLRNREEAVPLPEHGYVHCLREPIKDQYRVGVYIAKAADFVKPILIHLRPLRRSDRRRGIGVLSRRSNRSPTASSGIGSTRTVDWVSSLEMEKPRRIAGALFISASSIPSWVKLECTRVLLRGQGLGKMGLDTEECGGFGAERVDFAAAEKMPRAKDCLNK